MRFTSWKRPGPFAGLLLLILAGIVVGSLTVGPSGATSLGDTGRGVLAVLGLSDPLPGSAQTILELRLYRTLAGIGVGAALSYSGGLLQGVFRNDLASPGIIGISAGASLGASLAILVLGGYAPGSVGEAAAPYASLFVGGAAFAGATSIALVVTLVASVGGRISVPTLLLVGIAMNAVAGGLLSAVQSFVLQDFEVTRAMYAWTFGTLEITSVRDVAVVFSAAAVAACAIPFVAFELDLFASGEDDARALGVDTRRVRLIALLAATLAAGVAVSVAGQIAFVGLVVPHLLRLTTGRSHRSLLPLCLVGGPVFLLGTDLAQRSFFGDEVIQPGAMMSLIGGPFFVFLLVRNRRSIQAW